MLALYRQHVSPDVQPGDLLDADGDGTITKEEFRTLFLRANPMSDKEFEARWRQAASSPILSPSLTPSSPLLRRAAEPLYDTYMAPV